MTVKIIPLEAEAAAQLAESIRAQPGSFELSGDPEMVNLIVAEVATTYAQELLGEEYA